MSDELSVDYEQLSKSLWWHIRERCIIEGCRYTEIPEAIKPNQPLLDKCIWCYEPRKGPGTISASITGLINHVG